MTAPHAPKVAGIEPSVPAPTQTAELPTAATAMATGSQLAAVQDRMAGWLADLATLHDLTSSLTRTRTLHEALRETARAGAWLVGARRGLVTLEPSDGLGPATTVGFGLGPADIGHLETVPRCATSYGRILDGLPEPDPATPPAAPDDPVPVVQPPAGGRPRPATPTHDAPLPGPGAGLSGPRPAAEAPAGAPVRTGACRPDLLGESDLHPRLREVAGRLGCAATYTVPLARERDAAAARGPAADTLGAAMWLFDEPAQPTERQRHLVGLYQSHAEQHLACLLELHRHVADLATLREELLPHRLPRIPGVRLAVRHSSGPRGGGDWYDALSLPEGAMGLAVGAVTGSGPAAVAAMGRLRSSLRAYAVMEGEDPVAVLSDLELLLRLTEPARSATALFAFAEPAARRVLLAGAGHCPPLLVGEGRAEYVETTVSAPLGMLACWEAPSVQITPEPGETLLLYSDGLLHRTGEPMDRAFTRLHAAACSAPRAARADVEALVDHVVSQLLPDGLDAPDSAEDVVLLAARFER
ncbi:PP2C family protein-serine/threonine phosphatase [Streptomyces sp. NPDC059740]|uniref:PP2C family protein-serine/threonine phosphatase n=1 Tax=Streptomyces sp. NPDC059740 TaxID=3346926 RepID=UPI0036553AD6